MTFPKRTFEKPIPISPTIALDRERCILCYRCTRFSESVAEDGQLVARDRGRELDHRHVRGRALPRAVLRQRDRALPGRRADVDPVPLRGAPVGDPERADRLRPLPGRLQHQRDHARGQGQADPLAEPSRDRRGLALRQGSLRVLASVRRRPRAGSAAQGRQAPLRGDLVGRRARRRPNRSCATQGPVVAGAVGLGDGRAGVRAGEAPAAGPRLGRRRAARAGFDRARRLPARRSRRSATPSVSIVVGDEPVDERAPVVDLWIKAARAPARRSSPSRRRDEPDAPGKAADAVRALGEQVRGAVLDLVGPRRGRRRRRRRPRARSSDAAAAFYLPATPNGRAVVEAWHAAGDGEPVEPEKIGVLLISGDDAAADPGVQSLAERADAVIAITMFADPVRGLGRSRAAGDELPGARRNDRQPRGPPAAPAPRGDPARAGRGGLDREAGRALRRRGRPARTRGRRRGVGEAASRRRASVAAPGEAAEDATDTDGEAAARSSSSATAPSSRDRRSSACPSSSSSGRSARSSSPSATRAHATSPPARRSSSARTAPRSRCARGSTGNSSTAPSAPPEEHVRGLEAAVEVTQAVNNGEPWWIGADQGGDLRQRPADLDGVPHALRAKAARAHAAALRPEPRRAERPPPAVRGPDQDGAQGGVRAGRGDRHALPAGAGLRSLHRAHRLQRDPLGRGLGHLALPRERRDRRRADLPDPDLRARLARGSTGSSSAAGRPSRSTRCSGRCGRVRRWSRTRSRSRCPCSASC